jgi:glycosyltransferase involved in cell wall biosynthesis
MNVAQVSHLYRPSIGGIENYSYRLANSLRESGHSVSVVTTDASLANDRSPLSVETDVTYCETTATVLRNPFSIELYQTVRRSMADVYHLHSPWYLSTLESVLALPAGTPVVMTIHGFQPIRSLAARVLDAAYGPFAQYVLDTVDRTIVLGRSEKERLLNEFDVSPADVSVIPNGIRPSEHDVSASAVERVHNEYGIDPSTPTVLYVSRLVPLKNPRVLVDAVSKGLPDVEMDALLVGNGERSYVSDLRDRADDRVRFLANLPFEDLQALYHAADVFVMPSRSEGLPTVVLEAMNAELPIVTTPVGALADVIDHRDHGWVLPSPPTARALVRAIRFYVEHPTERRATGERNRAYVRTAFDWENVARDIESVYEEVLGGR